MAIFVQCNPQDKPTVAHLLNKWLFSCSIIPKISQQLLTFSINSPPFTSLPHSLLLATGSYPAHIIPSYLSFILILSSYLNVDFPAGVSASGVQTQVYRVCTLLVMVTSTSLQEVLCSLLLLPAWLRCLLWSVLPVF